jgi:hypothetical protein
MGFCSTNYFTMFTYMTSSLIRRTSTGPEQFDQGQPVLIFGLSVLIFLCSMILGCSYDTVELLAFKIST